MKNFQYLLLFAVSLGLFIITACSEFEDTEEINSVSFNIGQFCSDDSTKTALVSTEFQWTANDTVGIYPATGSQVYFSMQSGAGSDKATFDGGGWAFKGGAKYYSYYPFIGDIYLDRKCIPVKFTGQVQNGVDNIDHFGKFDYMYTPETSPSEGAISFMYKHLVCIIHLDCTLPAGTYKQLTITAPYSAFTEEGYFNLTSETPSIISTKSSEELTVSFKEPFTVDGSTLIKAYLISAPVNFNGVEITVSAVDVNKKQYDCKKTPSKAYLAENLYGLTCSSWKEMPQTVGLAIEAWGDGGEINGNAN